MALRLIETRAIDYDGKEVTSSLATIKCDGPKCQGDEAPCGKYVSFDQVKPDEVPDKAYRVVTLMEFPGRKFSFLTIQCLREFLRDYTPLESPAEVARREANNESVDAKNRLEKNLQHLSLNSTSSEEETKVETPLPLAA